MPPSYPLPPKKEVALALLERSGVHIHLDPRRDGVNVPSWFKAQPQLVLQVGLNMPVPIPDLNVDDDGIQCTLSFNRSPFYCIVPWRSVYAMVGDDGRGMVWPEDVPAEVTRNVQTGPTAVPNESRKPTEPQEPRPRQRAASAKKGAPKGPRLAEGAGDAPKAAKKSRKKPRIVPPPSTEPRGILTAVPSPPPPPPEPLHANRRRAPAPNPPSPHRPTLQKKPTASKPRVKRELPPYLRVVK